MYIARLSRLIASRKLMAIVNTTLAAFLILSALLLVRDAVTLVFTDVSPKERQGEEGIQPTNGERAASLGEYAPILKDNVFGFPSEELVPLSADRRAESLEAEPIEAVNITLVGTVAWPDGFGYAFVRGASKEQEVFKTGEYISGVGRLAKVETYGIYVESGGREVKVPLEEVKEPEAGESNAAESHLGERGVPKGNGFARRTSETEFVLNQKAIEESLANPQNIMTDARLLPRVVNGEQDGFVMREVKPGGLYQTIGLQNGDVLLSVNDFKLSNPETALQAFTALRGMDKIKLDILRKGQKMTLTYTIR